MSCLRVVVLGRPNVGKSTLFNRLLGYRKSIVHDRPGVTRDRVVERTTWYTDYGRFAVELCDTGGVGEGPFRDEIARQVQIALSDADIGLFVVDSQTGIIPEDRELIESLRRRGVFQRVPLLLVVNKIDAETHMDRIQEFYGLGLDADPIPISAEHGRGVGDLQDLVMHKIKESFEAAGKALEPIPDEDTSDPQARSGRKKGGHDAIPRIAVVGKPNSGKSTLINFLLREERMIVSPIAGTTVDPIDSLVEMGGKPYVLVDTAGMRRRSKTEQGIEVLSIVQTRKTLQTADLALLLIDAEVGPTDQDEKIVSLIEEAGASVIVLVNKWDLKRKQSQDFTPSDAVKELRYEMSFLHYAPVHMVSAKTGYGLDAVAELVGQVLEQRLVQISTKDLTDWAKAQFDAINPYKLKFYYGHQTGSHPPTFTCRVSDPERVHFSLKRQLLRNLRGRYGFLGTPVRLNFLKSQ